MDHQQRKDVNNKEVCTQIPLRIQEKVKKFEEEQAPTPEPKLLSEYNFHLIINHASLVALTQLTGNPKLPET